MGYFQLQDAALVRFGKGVARAGGTFMVLHIRTFAQDDDPFEGRPVKQARGGQRAAHIKVAHNGRLIHKDRACIGEIAGLNGNFDSMTGLGAALYRKGNRAATGLFDGRRAEFKSTGILRGADVGSGKAGEPDSFKADGALGMLAAHKDLFVRYLKLRRIGDGDVDILSRDRNAGYIIIICICRSSDFRTDRSSAIRNQIIICLKCDFANIGCRKCSNIRSRILNASCSIGVDVAEELTVFFTRHECKLIRVVRNSKIQSCNRRSFRNRYNIVNSITRFGCDRADAHTGTKFDTFCKCNVGHDRKNHHNRKHQCRCPLGHFQTS